MNTPTPTPRTDAATYPADCLGKTLVTNRDLARALETELAALRAVFPQICASLGNGAGCTPTVSVGFIESIPNEVQLVVDQLRADCENETKWAAHYLAQSIADKARAERAEADAAAYLKRAESFSKLADEAEADAERYRLVTLRQDADLAAERARLDWVFRNCKVIADGYTIHDREDLGVAMKEHAK